MKTFATILSLITLIGFFVGGWYLLHHPDFQNTMIFLLTFLALGETGRKLRLEIEKEEPHHEYGPYRTPSEQPTIPVCPCCKRETL